MSEPSTSPPPQKPVARRWAYAALVVAFLLVLMPYLFWRATWFGRPLSDEQLARYLADREKPRKTQHALSQVADRILAGDARVRSLYPPVVALKDHPASEIRLTAAWVMGQDNSVPEFREALRGLLGDAHPMVRRNAALALVRFGDASGRKEIVAMLSPHAAKSPAAGNLQQRLKPGEAVNPGTLLGRIDVGGEQLEVRSEVPGTLTQWLVPEGASVDAGRAIALVAPSSEVVWEALRALYLVGQPEDLTEVERCAAGIEGLRPEVAQQAAATARAIRERAGNQD